MYNKAKGAVAKDLGFGYKKSYKDKKTGKDTGYLKLSIRPEILADIAPSANGLIELVVFSNTSPKKSDKSPDVTVKPAVVKKAENAAPTQNSAGTNSSTDFPF